MYAFITILIILICLLIMLVVLVQNPKGGGLGVGFGGGSSNIMGGVKQTTDFLEKATWTLAAALIVLSLLSNAFLPSEKPASSTGTDTQIENILNK
ncbi:preprotein translocase subunit SecG [Sphingobacteriales bacterium UPWRP_1]|nr:preprotein translocase subunit SecG [Sphingobacteriales bacterium UPWRP_1]